MEDNQEKHKTTDNKELLSKKDENREYHFVYFIESHDKSKTLNIYLSSNYKDSGTLENIEEKDLSTEKESLISNLYRFKLFPDNYEQDKKEGEVEVIIEEKKMEDILNTSKYIIKINNIHKDFYEYNLKMDQIAPIKLTYEQKFELYTDFLRKKLKKLQTSKENEEFITSTQLFLEENKFNLLFYLLIFLECFSTKLLDKLLEVFKPEKLIGNGEVSESKLSKIKNILNSFSKSPEKIKLENEEKRKERTETFYFIYFYFNANFQKNKLEEIFTEEKIFNYSFDNIINYQKNIPNLILPKEIVCKLIEKSKTLKQALTSLLYLGKNTVNVLEVINNKKEDILNLINEDEDNNENEEKEENEDKKVKNLELEKYILPKEEDDLLKMSQIINEILNYEKKETKFIDFSSPIFEEYIKMNINSSIDNLTYLNQIVVSIKKVHLKFDIPYKMDILIHDTSLELIKKKKLNNLEILDFILKDEFYNNDKYKKHDLRTIKVFDGIDIGSLNDEFFKKWNEIDLNKMFEEKIKEYSNKIGSLINNMKDFKLLFKLFKIEIGKDNPFDYIDTIKNRFIELNETYNENACKDFFENGALLICIHENKKLNTKKFLKNLNQKFDTELLNNIYIKTDELYYEYLSKETKEYRIPRNYCTPPFAQKPGGVQ